MAAVSYTKFYSLAKMPESSTATPIRKSSGSTPTERLLSRLCERTFHKLWSYPNPFKDDRDELCDLIVCFDGRILLFFDRESRKFDGSSKNISITWNRWKKEAIDKQIRTAKGAERYILSGRPIFLDSKNSHRLPIEVEPSSKISKFVIAHGAKEACKEFSSDNIYGSLAISYGDKLDGFDWPFFVELDSSNIIHILDTHNLELLFTALDTVRDFSSYIIEKERAISSYKGLAYCGEEDLIAHYLSNFQKSVNQYRIGPINDDSDFLLIGEGEWRDFVSSERFVRRQQANRISYFWDELIQRTCQNALDGTVGGNADIFQGKSAIHEMAKEPRYSRRSLSERIKKAIEAFPDSESDFSRHVSFMSSHYKDTGYVFLQIRVSRPMNYDAEYHPLRQRLLEVACGAAKIKLPHLKKIIGIAIDAPKFAKHFSEDFLLLDCTKWSETEEKYYSELNRELGFFSKAESQNAEYSHLRLSE